MTSQYLSNVSAKKRLRVFTASAFFCATLLLPTFARNADSHAADIQNDAAPKISKNAPPAGATKREIEMGKSAAEKLEKDPRFKLWNADKDPKAKIWLEKLNAMATAFGKVSARPLIKYQVKVFEDKDINAFTLPNGYIYFSSGLIEAAGSDDEVASVLAHEIGHNVRMHVVRGESKSKPLQWVSLAAMLAALGGGEAGTNIAQIAPYILTGVVNSYSVAYEKEADETAIELMSKTSYNPSALVSFMNRLTAEERRRPEVQLGIYQTHPLTPERSDAALKQIAKMGIAFTPRAVTGSKEAVVEVMEDRVRVAWGDASLMEFFPVQTAASAVKKADKATQKPTSSTREDKTTGGSEKETAKKADAPPVVVTLSPALAATKKRADATVLTLNSLMRDNLRLYEISVVQDASGASLVARGQILASATVFDALALKTTPLALAKTWRSNLQRLFWKEVTGGAF